MQLTGWGLDIITDDQYQERRAKQEKYQKAFQQIPGVSELIALSLTTSGFDSIASVTEAELVLLQTVPGLEEAETASAIRETATQYFAEHGEVDLEALSSESAEAETESASGGEAGAADAVASEVELTAASDATAIGDTSELPVVEPAPTESSDSEPGPEV